MSQKNPFGMLHARQIIWLIATSVLAGTLFLILFTKLHLIFLTGPLLIFVLVAIDSFQTKHSVRKNYPLIGRLRYFFESVRPEFRQYFFANPKEAFLALNQAG